MTRREKRRALVMALLILACCGLGNLGDVALFPIRVAFAGDDLGPPHLSTIPWLTLADVAIRIVALWIAWLALPKPKDHFPDDPPTFP